MNRPDNTCALQVDPKKLQRLREGKALSREKLAEKAGVHKKTVERLEKGEIKKPRMETIRMIANALEVSPQDLYWGTDGSPTLPSGGANATLRLNFIHLIETHTRLFAGRDQWLQNILDFIHRESCGYIFLEGLSGYGKTSLLAKLVQENPHFTYHFISQTYKVYGTNFDPTEMESLLLNLCEQLEGHRGNLLGTRFLQERFQTLLRSSPTNAPRVIIIDAVDEINRHPNYLRGLLPGTLAPGVFIVFSARKLGDRNYLHEIGLEMHQIGRTIFLPGLDEEAITALLESAGGPARALAHSASFVQQIYNISEGDPFYLRFLVEDILHGLININNISNAPSGLDAYFELQLSLLDRSAYLAQQRDIVGLILNASSALSRYDLITMVAGLDGLNFENIMRDIRRFLLSYEDKYTLCHSRFKEYFLSKNTVR